MTQLIKFAMCPMCLVILSIAGQGTADESARRFPRTATTDISGRWFLTLPAGFEYEATMERVGEQDLYRLSCPATNLSGVYRLRDGKLTAITPDNERMTGLAWELKNRNVLLLTVHPETASVGSDYRDATLCRRKTPDERTPGAEQPDLMIEVLPPLKDARPVEMKAPHPDKASDRGVERMAGKSVVDLLGKRMSIRLQGQGTGIVGPEKLRGSEEFVHAILDGRIVPNAKMVYHLQPIAQECLVKTPEGVGRVGILYPPVGYVVLPSGEGYWFSFGNEAR